LALNLRLLGIRDLPLTKGQLSRSVICGWEGSKNFIQILMRAKTLVGRKPAELCLGRSLTENQAFKPAVFVLIYRH